METLRSRKTLDAREARRYRAVELSEAGWTQTAIAQALGVTQGAVSQWLKRVKEGGVEALRPKPVPGTPRKLKTDDLAKLPSLLEKGAEAFGFLGAVWTRRRVATVIERVFGVRYTPQHVGHLLDEIGWSRQKPQRRARQQNIEAVQTFQERTWPRIKRGD